MNLHYNPTLTSARIDCKEFNKTLAPQTHQNVVLEAIDAFSFGFLQLDFNGKILHWSPAAEQLTGYSKEQVLHQCLFEAIPETNQIKFRKHWTQLLNHRTRLRIRDYYWPVQGWFEFYVYPTESNVIIYFKDISKKIAFRHKLSRKINQLKEVSLYNSHAIRKPIANLIGLTKLLNEDIKLEEFKKFVAYINKSIRDLDGIITNLNTIVNSDDYHQLTPKLEHFHFKPLIYQISKQINSETSHKVEVRCSDVIFYGDRAGISSSIKALIYRAIGASTGATVKINISIKHQNLCVNIYHASEEISDETIKDIHSHITNNKPSNHYSDFIKTAQVCFKHHGTFWIERKIGEGNSYRMLFPLHRFSSFDISATSSYKKNEMLVHLETSSQYLYVKWIGFFDETSKKRNFYKLFEIFKVHPFTKIINDETEVVGGNINGIHWLTKYGFPLLKKSGLSHFAWITSKDEFAKLSASTTMKRLNNPPYIKIFPYAKPALAWIRKQKKEMIINAKKSPQ